MRRNKVKRSFNEVLIALDENGFTWGNHGEATIMNPNICAKLKHDQFEHNPKQKINIDSLS
jgi:hypothetical protein